MPNDNCLGQNYDLCPEIKKTMEGAAYSSVDIKVRCKECRYDDYRSCKKFPRIKDEFTGNMGEFTYKRELNSNGECKYFIEKTFLQRIFRIT